MARYVASVLALLLLSLVVSAEKYPGKKLQAKGPLAKRGMAPPAKISCQMYQQMEDNEYRWNQYQCYVQTNSAAPVCVELNCIGVTIGKPPIGGTGAGTNIIRPGPHSDNIGANCTSQTPLYPPNGSWYFDFLTTKETPVRVTVKRVYPATGNAC